MQLVCWWFSLWQFSYAPTCYLELLTLRTSVTGLIFQQRVFFVAFKGRFGPNNGILCTKTVAFVKSACKAIRDTPYPHPPSITPWQISLSQSLSVISHVSAWCVTLPSCRRGIPPTFGLWGSFCCILGEFNKACPPPDITSSPPLSHFPLINVWNKRSRVLRRTLRMNKSTAFGRRRSALAAFILLRHSGIWNPGSVVA